MGEGTRILTRVGALSRGFEVPEAGLVVLADGDVFPEEVHLHARGRRRGLRTFLLGLPRPQDGRPRRARGARHRPLPGARDARGRRRYARVHGARLPGRRQAQGPGRGLRPDPEVHERGRRAPAARPARQRPVGEDQDARQKAMRDMADELLQALRRAQGPARPRLLRRQPLAAGVRGCLRVRRDAGPGRGHRRGRRATWSARADGPPAVRRRGLRQDRGGHARRLQGGAATASRWRCWRPPRCSRSSTARPSASASRPSRCASR